MDIAAGLAEKTSNRSSAKCRVSRTWEIRYFILFQWPSTSAIFLLPPPLPPYPPRLKSIHSFRSPTSNGKRGIILPCFYFASSKSTVDRPDGLIVPRPCPQIQRKFHFRNWNCCVTGRKIFAVEIYPRWIAA